MEQKYNGWNNYETWLANLWLDNDEHECNHHLPEMARDAYRDACANAYSTREQDAARSLAEALKDYIEEQNPIGDQSGMFADLLSAALDSIDWREIAEHLIEDLDKDEFDDESDEDADDESDEDASDE